MSARRGVIYVLANQYMPGLVKIGLTTRSPEVRARELSRATGVPDEFEIIYDEIVSDADRAEAAIHELLAASRVNRAREFFRIDIRNAIKAVQQICKSFPVDEESEAVSVEVLPLLEVRMRRWLRRELVAVAFVQFSDLCLLRVTEQPDLRLDDAIQTMIDLRIFGDDDDDEFGDGLLFNPRRTLRQNVAAFLDLDAYSMIVTGLGLLSEEASDHVAHLVEDQQIQPPLEPRWVVSSTAYEMWGSADPGSRTDLIRARLQAEDALRLGMEGRD